MTPARQPSRLTDVLSRAALIVVTVLFVTPPSSQGSEEFVLGSADTKAEFLSVGPSTAGLHAGLIVGQALADYQNKVARAQARSIDTTIYGTSLTMEGCDGSDPYVHNDDMPDTVRVDSREPDAQAGQTRYWPIMPRDLPYQFADAKEENGGFPNLDPGPDSPARADVFRLSARASERPASLASVDTGVVNVVGVAEAIGGRVETSTEIDGTTRRARAVTEIPELRLGGGAVVMRDLRWEVVQTTGPKAPADTTRTASFAVGSVTIGDATLAFPDDASAQFQEQLGALLRVVNTALAPSGLRVEFPHEEDDRDHARVTPLVVEVWRPPLGRELASLLPAEVYEARRQFVDALLEARCDFASVVTAGDILLATPTGAGATSVAFGGVTAFTEGSLFSSPFQEPDVRGVTVSRGESPSGGSTAGLAAPSPDTAAGEGAPLSDRPAPTAASEGAGVGLIPAVRVKGPEPAVAIVVGLLALAAVLGVAGFDYLRGRHLAQALLASAGSSEPVGEER